MQEVRRRKRKDDKQRKKAPVDAQKKTDDRVDVVAEAPVKTNGSLTILYIIFGLGVAGYLGYRYATFVKLLHENDMWFSQITVSCHCLGASVCSHLLNDRRWRGRSHSVQNQDCITHTINSLLILLHLHKVMLTYIV